MLREFFRTSKLILGSNVVFELELELALETLKLFDDRVLPK